MRLDLSGGCCNESVVALVLYQAYMYAIHCLLSVSEACVLLERMLASMLKPDCNQLASLSRL